MTDVPTITDENIVKALTTALEKVDDAISQRDKCFSDPGTGRSVRELVAKPLDRIEDTEDGRLPTQDEVQAIVRRVDLAASQVTNPYAEMDLSDARRTLITLADLLGKRQESVSRAVDAFAGLMVTARGNSNPTAMHMSRPADREPIDLERIALKGDKGDYLVESALLGFRQHLPDCDQGTARKVLNAAVEDTDKVFAGEDLPQFLGSAVPASADEAKALQALADQFKPVTEELPLLDTLIYFTKTSRHPLSSLNLTSGVMFSTEGIAGAKEAMARLLEDKGHEFDKADDFTYWTLTEALAKERDEKYGLVVGTIRS
jgi:hypothetical protein